MKTKYLIPVSIFFIAFYSLLLIFLSLKISISTDLLVRLIMTLIAMILLVFVISKEKSNFANIFSVVSVIYFVLDVFYSLINSLLQNKVVLFSNMTLSKSEGFITLTCIVFLLHSLTQKKKS